MSFNRFSILIVILLAIFASIIASAAVKESKSSSPKTPVSQPAKEAAPLTPYLLPNGDVVLFDFEDVTEADRFVYGNVNTYIEPSSEIVRSGSRSCCVTYYVGAIRQNKRPVFYTLMHPARGRLNDWSPYTEFTAAIYNAEKFTVSLDIEYADGTTSIWRRYNLPPQVWSRLRQPLEDLSNSGLSLRSMKRIAWSQLDTDMIDINTLYFDDIRLTGANPNLSQKVLQKAWENFEKWEAEEGSKVRAAYVPSIRSDKARIQQIESKYNCGEIDGYINTKVCVVGGGMAGCSAAISSARLGVDTLLVEQYGFLGGTATASLVTPFMSNRVGNMDLVRGIYEDIVDELIARGGAKRDSRKPGVIYFDDEELKYVLNSLVIDSGAKLLLHSWAERPLVHDDVCEGIIVNNKSGRIAIIAKVVVDTTGDGDIAAKAGCPYEIGRGYDQHTQSATLFLRMGGVNENVVMAQQNSRLVKTGNVIPPYYMFADIFKKAVSDGFFPADIPIRTVYFEKTVDPGVISINATRVFEVDGTNVLDLTYASVETRRQAIKLADMLIKYVPGFEKAFLQETGVQVGIRESRRIIGEYQLSGRDVLHAKKFPDVIAMGAFDIDIHVPDYSGGGVVGLSLEEGKSYDIPYRCLVPKNIDNILVGGRCISVSHMAFGSTRIMPISSGTGHAAGAAAALCVLYNVTPRKLEYSKLREALIDQGAKLN